MYDILMEQSQVSIIQNLLIKNEVKIYAIKSSETIDEWWYYSIAQ